jgi:hypothetical protein
MMKQTKLNFIFAACVSFVLKSVLGPEVFSGVERGKGGG